MFLVELTYKTSLEEVDKHLKAHIEFLNKYREKKVFILAGRKLPRSGGIIIVNVPDRESLDNVLSEDPFMSNKLADFDITEFAPSVVTEELNFLKQA